MKYQFSILLRNPENRGYPAEYLLSRIRGRKGHLITDWKSLVFGIFPAESPPSRLERGPLFDNPPDGIWRELKKEFRWVYLQMNETLREIFQPFFLYAELRTLSACLRHIKAGQPRAGTIEDILALSLLSERIGKVLRGAKDYPSAVTGIERLFLPLSADFRGLAKIAETEGSRGVESEITKRYLAYVVRAKLHPVMKSFFIRIVDARNVISLYKCVRLGEEVPPPFIPGGNMDMEKFREAGRKNILDVGPLIRKFTGVRIEKADATHVEHSLYRAMTGFLRKEGREPLGIGLILDYLWRCSIEAMNLSIIFYGKDVERETIMTELIH